MPVIAFHCKLMPIIVIASLHENENFIRQDCELGDLPGYGKDVGSGALDYL